MRITYGASLSDIVNSRFRETVLLMIAVTAVMIGAAVVWAWTSYDEIESEQVREDLEDANKALTALENNVLTNVDAADSYARWARTVFIERGGDALRQEAERVNNRRRIRPAESLTVTDRLGNVIFSHPSPAARTVYLGDLDYFQYLQTLGGEGIFIDPARRGRVAPNFYFRVVRPLLRGGVFDGVAIVTLSPERLVEYYRKFDLWSNNVMAVFTLDHKLVARYPQPAPENYERQLENLPLWEQLKNKSAGEFKADGHIDGICRYYIYRQMKEYPLVLAVGVSEGAISDHTAPARAAIVRQLLTFALVAICGCLLTLAVLAKNRKLAAAERAAHQAHDDRMRLVVAVAHDLAQPLKACHLYLEQAMAGPAPSAIAKALQASRLGEEMLGQLVDFVAIEEGRIVPHFKVFDVWSVVEPIVSLFQPFAGSDVVFRGVRCGAQVYSDPDLIGRIVLNLISNAVQYTRRGKILLGCRRSGDDLRLEIWDTGPGIEPEKRKAIFNAFQRGEAPTGTAVSLGLGLGLAVVDGLARSLDARLEFCSVVGKGTRFAIILPAA